jgi:uncharacterized protein (UPF0303 family)
VNPADIDADLARLAEQRAAMRLAHFDEADAWALGCDLRARAAAAGAAVTIEVRLLGATVFLNAMPGTAPANADWARRKRNVVELLHEPSYAIGLQGRRDGRSLLDVMGLDARDHADHGGAVPVVVAGVGQVGVATVSGLPQRDDHELVVAALAVMAGVDVAAIALPLR